MNPSDAVHLLFENPSSTFHVGDLVLLDPAPGLHPMTGRSLRDGICAERELRPMFRCRPVGRGISAPWWVNERAVDLEYHVRLATVPGAGRFSDLMGLISRLFAKPLDRQRPVWQTYVIDGLQDGRIAMFTKMHRALTDETAAQQLLVETLSARPGTRCPAPWNPRAVTPAGIGPPSGSPLRRLQELSARTVRLPANTVRAVIRASTEYREQLPTAPNTVLNATVGEDRGFTTGTIECDRVDELANASGAGSDAVVLAMCAGAIARYLRDRRALPAAPLTALTPISGDGTTRMAVVDLATDEIAPDRRLGRITESLRRATQLIEGLNPLEYELLHALTIGLPRPARPTQLVGQPCPSFNLVISRSQCPADATYFNGARIDGLYPAPPVTGRQALNLAVTRRGDCLDIGVVACRRAVPDYGRIPVDLEMSLTDLEASVL